MAKKPLGHNKLVQFSYPHDVADVSAIKALAVGEANADQQKRALDFIIRDLAMTYDETFHSESERASAFMQGRRFVGLKLVLFINIRLDDVRLRADPNAQPSERG